MIFKALLFFYRMKDFVGKGPGALAQNVLAEVPNQLLSYMQQHNIRPGSAKPLESKR